MTSPTPPTVCVVIPYFNDAAGLRAVLEGVIRQDYPGVIHVVVADDGSTVAADPGTLQPADGSRPVTVTVVRQEDHGFRAAAARNLGAAAATAEILAFLDGDTIPQPGYLSAVVQTLSREPRAVVVGTRTHVDTTQDPPRDLGQPQWLADAWEATDHLRGGDDTNFRFVISAVLSCRAEVFWEIGGFDTSMVGYGGEDWEFAWQAHVRGFDLRHQPAALAVHLGVDWGGRSAADHAAAVQVKNAETLRLGSRITHPTVRLPGVVHAVADVAVTLPLAPQTFGGAWQAGSVVLAVTDLLAAGDVHVTVRGAADGAVPPEVLQAFAADPRVRFTGPAETGAAEAGPAETGSVEVSSAEVASAGEVQGRVVPRFDVVVVRACHIPAGGLQAVCEQIAQAGGAGEVATVDGDVLLHVTPRRAAARGERQVTRITRDWTPVDGAPALEGELRRRGQTYC